MPIGILIIINKTFLNMRATAKEYASRIDSYFEYIKGRFHYETTPAKDAKKGDPPIEEKIWDRPPEPPLITALALHIGFTSLQEMERYSRKGKLAKLLWQAKLRVEKEYERKLHMQAPTGAIFALKNLGWKDRADTPQVMEMPKSIRVEMVMAGPKLAASEKDVQLSD
jgi:hypothetical protein